MFEFDTIGNYRKVSLDLTELKDVYVRDMVNFAQAKGRPSNFAILRASLKKKIKKMIKLCSI